MIAATKLICQEHRWPVDLLVPREVTGVILRTEKPSERACGFLKLRAIDGYEIEIRPAETLSQEDRGLLRIGSCVALRVSFAHGLKRWWGTPTVGVIRSVGSLALRQVDVR